MRRYTVVLAFDPEVDSYAVSVPALGEHIPDDVSPLVYMIDIQQPQLAR